jgi:hypothetical protein
VGPRLAVLDVSNPYAPELLGESEILPALISDIWLVNNLLYVASGVGGLQILDVSNPFAPRVIGALPTARNSLGIHVNGNYAYIANSDGGLRIVDVSNPAEPVESGARSLGRDVLARDVWAIDSYAYVAAGVNGLYIVDISDPANPFVTSTLTDTGNTQSLFAVDDILYVASGNALMTLDLTIPYSPTVLYSEPIPLGNGVGIVVSGNYAYLACMEGGLQIFDVSDPNHPDWVGSYSYFEGVFNTFISGQYAYLAAGLDNLQIIDVSNPANPRRLSRGYDMFGKAQGFMLRDTAPEYAFIGAAQDGLWIVDASDPANLTTVGSLDLDGNCRGIDLKDNLAYLACSIGGLYVLDVADVARPQVISWLTYTLSAGGYRELDVISDTLVVADWGGVLKIDVTNPSTPTVTDQSAMVSMEPHAIQVEGNFAYVAGDGGLTIVDITQPLLPAISTIDTVGNNWDLQVVDGIAYLAGGNSGLWIVDVTNPYTPTTLATYNISQYAIGLHVDQNIAYVSGGLGGVYLIDVHNPQHPIEITHYDSPGYTEYSFYANDILYLSDGGGGLFTLNLNRYPTPLAPDVSLATMGGFSGEEGGDLAGSAITALGDVNGDGLDDFALSAPSYGTEAIPDRGMVYLFFGKSYGWPSQTLSLSLADASFYGEEARDGLGQALAGVGDVNNDGLNDLLVGAPGSMNLTGQTYLILGNADPAFWRTNLPVTDLATASFWGEAVGDNAGASLAAIGDVNGDLIADFLIGAPDNAEGGANAGQVYLIQGKTADWAMDTPLSSAAQASFLGRQGINAGQSIAGAGDVDGDGLADFLIAAPLDDYAFVQGGQVFLLLGQETGWTMDVPLTDANASFTGEGENHWAGFSIAGVGDVNGDTFDDFLIGAPGAADHGPHTGKAYLIFGKATGWTLHTSLSTADASFIGEWMGDWAGQRVAAAGDLDQDTFADFLIAAPSNDDGARDAGQIYLIRGKSSGWAQNTSLHSAPASFWGEVANDGAGLAMAAIGDVDGNGLPDLAIAAPQSDLKPQGGLPDSPANDDAGKISLFFGNDGPAAGNFQPISPFQGINIYHSLTTSYFDLLNGYTDLDDARLTLRGGGEQVTFRYMRLEQAFYMLDGDSWIGPCYKTGGSATLSNGTFELNCKTSSISNDGAAALIINWRIRVIKQITWPYTLDVILQAFDQSGNSELLFRSSLPVQAGFWEINPTAPLLDLSQSETSFTGEGADDLSGWSVAAAGDVNGDGLGDFLIGAPYQGESGTNAGQVYLFFGRAEGWGQSISLSQADASFTGEAAGDYAGFALAGVGDVNGDSFDDFLIGAYNNAAAGSSAGRVYLLYGKAEGWMQNTPLSQADVIFTAEGEANMVGYALAAAGNVNGDAYADLLIGAWGKDYESQKRAGAAYLILGRETFTPTFSLSQADASFLGETGESWLGYSLAGVGDVDGNGLDDLLLAAPNDSQTQGQAGKIYLFLSKAEGWLPNTLISTADLILSGQAEGDMAGIAVSAAGDVNGDALADFLIGAWGAGIGLAEEAGVTYLILGRESFSQTMNLETADGSFVGERANDRAGRAVAGVGDLNADGYADFAIGAYGANDGGPNAGKAYLIYGQSEAYGYRANLSEADRLYLGESSGDYAALSIAGLHNIRVAGDHYLLIGAPAAQKNGLYHSGQTHLTQPPPDLQFIQPPLIYNNLDNVITLHGANFLPQSLLTIEEVPLIFSFVNSQTLTATIAAGTTVGVYDFSITNPDKQMDVLVGGLTITLPPPQLQTITPTWVTNDVTQTLTLNGSFFEPVPTVTVGTTPLAVEFLNSATLNVELFPGFPAGVYTVTLTNPDGQQDSLTNTLTVIQNPPDLQAILPAQVSNEITQTLTLSGSHFLPFPTLTIGTFPFAVSFVNQYLLTTTLPAEFTPGVYTVTVTNWDGQTDSLPSGLKVTLPPPILEYIEPVSVTNDTNNVINVFGYYFQISATVTVGTTPLKTTFVSSRSLLIVLPSWFPGGIYDITVVNPDGLQDTLEAALTVTDARKKLYVPLVLR